MASEMSEETTMKAWNELKAGMHASRTLHILGMLSGFSGERQNSQEILSVILDNDLDLRAAFSPQVSMCDDEGCDGVCAMCKGSTDGEEEHPIVWDGLFGMGMCPACLAVYKRDGFVVVQ